MPVMKTVRNLSVILLGYASWYLTSWLKKLEVGLTRMKPLLKFYGEIDMLSPVKVTKAGFGLYLDMCKAKKEAAAVSLHNQRQHLTAK